MSEPVRCASCGLPLDPPGPGGLCPICLLKMGLQAAEEPDTAGAPTSGAPAAGAVPGVIGPYHLLQVLGEGGMGLVYLAEQREPLVRRGGPQAHQARDGHARGAGALRGRAPGPRADGPPEHRPRPRCRASGPATGRTS